MGPVPLSSPMRHTGILCLDFSTYLVQLLPPDHFNRTGAAFEGIPDHKIHLLSNLVNADGGGEGGGV